MVLIDFNVDLFDRNSKNLVSQPNFAIVGDDHNTDSLFVAINSFYNQMAALTAGLHSPEFRLVHRSPEESLTMSRWRRFISPMDVTCPDDGRNNKGYSVTDIASCINSYGTFDECFRRKVSDDDSTICVGNAYHAMYADLAQESNKRIAFKFSVHPFPNQHEGRFHADAVYKFSKPGAMSYRQLLHECNKVDSFVDSALIITDARFSFGQWQDSFSSTNRRAWTELNKCALSEAQDAPEKYDRNPSACINYLRERQPEDALTNVNKRKKCPMIPDFGNSRISRNLPILIANKFSATHLDIYRSRY